MDGGFIDSWVVRYLDDRSHHTISIAAAADFRFASLALRVAGLTELRRSYMALGM